MGHDHLNIMWYALCMPRQARIDIAGEVYHVINRANARLRIFVTHKDYAAVLKALEEVLANLPIDIFSFCIMPNHWHFSVRSRRNGDMGRFFGKFTQKVTQCWHAAHQSAGSGHLFQGRFKSFLVEKDSYFLQLMQYIESNPLRAGLVKRAEDWKWSSLYVRTHDIDRSIRLLADWPVHGPADYLSYVNRSISQTQLRCIRQSVIRGNPLGNDSWAQKMIRTHDLRHTIRERGRPKNKGHVPFK